MLRIYRYLERRAPQGLKNAIPERWRIWLGYKIKAGWRAKIEYQHYLTHEVVLPAGETEPSLLKYLSRFHMDGEEIHEEELHSYLHLAFRRFLYTLQLVPKGSGKLLEIGAGPYFASLLLRRFTRYDLHYTNYFGPAFGEQASQTMVSPDERVRFDFYNVNIEADPLPFPENVFDVVLLCEVLEHFIDQPLLALRHIKQVLKPGGHLILTTPNVSRLENVGRMFAGHNIYDPYSAYGPHGRHNREYNWDELCRLLEHAGFALDVMFTSDVHPNEAHRYLDPAAITALVKQRRKTLGQYLFVRARNEGSANPGKPAWLYRSYPTAELTS